MKVEPTVSLLLEEGGEPCADVEMGPLRGLWVLCFQGWAAKVCFLFGRGLYWEVPLGPNGLAGC